MMRFELQKEPEKWKDRCRLRGEKWLKEHPGYNRPEDYWTDFEPDLRAAFRNMCAYCAMVIMKANMDHFIPVAELKKLRRDNQAYEWSNFRYGEGVLNQRKSDHLILDPFQVKDDWFRILLPSLQLEITPKIPKTQRAKAKFTVEKLGLRDDEVVVRYRQQWFEMYRRGTLTLDGLREVAPLIARAVDDDIKKGKDWKYPPPRSR